MAHLRLQTDGSGNIILRPMVGWAVHPIAGTAILLAVQFVKDEEALEAGNAQVVQLVLNAPLALELAEELKQVSERVLAPSPPGTPLQ